ncbi:MAG: FAD binding domain-containing protein, partial [Anaerolineae bacterium]|nr:FAD binding domain-containing protein [Anaerolineae bacterium]
MREIAYNENGLTIGAATTMNQVADSPEVQQHYTILAESAATVGSYQLRNRATLGGNLCNASPAADAAPALLALDAEAVIFGPRGQRIVPLTGFFTGPGKTVLGPGEILTAVHVPFPPRGCAGRYLKLGRTRIGDIAVIGVAVLGYPHGANPSGTAWRIALGAVAPTPLRAPRAEAILAAATDEAAVEMAALAAMETARPIDDIRASAAYRRAMVRALTRRGVNEILGVLGAVV